MRENLSHLSPCHGFQINQTLHMILSCAIHIVQTGRTSGCILVLLLILTLPNVEFTEDLSYIINEGGLQKQEIRMTQTMSRMKMA